MIRWNWTTCIDSCFILKLVQASPRYFLQSNLSRGGWASLFHWLNSPSSLLGNNLVCLLACWPYQSFTRSPLVIFFRVFDRQSMLMWLCQGLYSCFISGCHPFPCFRYHISHRVRFWDDREKWKMLHYKMIHHYGDYNVDGFFLWMLWYMIQEITVLATLIFVNMIMIWWSGRDLGRIIRGIHIERLRAS